MEQATNLFTKGLLLDTHPMVLGNDTLTDCLNGTLITMNGNEIILQNDMGNRRVDHAFLPSGYEPVGIKEYGGIIYIAAYNPITNKSLIGSFPSPERILSGIDNKGLGTDTYDFFDMFTNNGDGINFVEKDIELIKLSEDTSLHAGDKFSVYSDYIWENKNYITNFDTKKTPKYNNYFTLSLGILNSLNEFVDITKSLKRFDCNGKIISGLESDEAKFNTGYFISPQTDENKEDIINDNIDIQREQKAVNTYAYKLVGPLYLKTEVNHINSFSYDISSSKEGNTITLYITGTAVYNCPDSKSSDSESSNSKSYIDSFDLYYHYDDDTYKKYGKNDEEKDIIIVDRYKNGNNYISTITKKYIFKDFGSNHNLYYYICVPLFCLNITITNNLEVTNNIGRNSIGRDSGYIKNLSDEGVIKIDNIGTNSCELKSWRFKNIISDNKITKTLITYSFEMYKDFETKFDNLEIKFTDLSEKNNTSFNIPLFDTNVKNGKSIIEFENLDNKIKFRHFYEVTISWKQNGDNEVERTRFLLGTKLFNKCYDVSSEYFLNDYLDFTNLSNPNLTDKHKSLLEVDTELTNYDFKVDYVKTKSSQTGELILFNNPNNDNKEVEYTQKYELTPNLNNNNLELKIKNEELYPLGIKTTLDLDSINQNFSYNTNVENLNIITSDTTNNESFKNELFSILENGSKYDVTINDKLTAKYTLFDKKFGCIYSNLYHSVEKPIDSKIINLIEKNQLYGGIYLKGNNSGNTGIIDFVFDTGSNKYSYQQLYTLVIDAAFRNVDEDNETDLNEGYNNFKNYFIGKQNICLFIFKNFSSLELDNFLCKDLGTIYNNKYLIGIPNEHKSLKQYSRVFWNNGYDLILLDLLVDTTGNINSIYKQIIKFLGEKSKLVIPLKDFKMLFYAPSKNYSYKYNTNYLYNINFINKVNYSYKILFDNGNTRLNFSTISNKNEELKYIISLKSNKEICDKINSIMEDIDEFCSNIHYDFETNKIIPKSTIKLYVRGNNDLLIDISEYSKLTNNSNYPIELNTVDSEFPIICNKEYDGTQLTYQYLYPDYTYMSALYSHSLYPGYLDWNVTYQKLIVLTEDDLDITKYQLKPDLDLEVEDE